MAALRCERFRPDIAAASDARVRAARSTDAAFLRFDTAAFAAIPADSIDYAVMEPASTRAARASTIRMVPLDAGWSDLGAWDAVWQVGAQDGAGNAVQGDALVRDSRNTLVHATSRLVGVIGLDDVTVVETRGRGARRAPLEERSDVKELVASLARERPHRGEHASQVHRPWGWYESIDHGARFQVKRILVKPGARLSLQMHHHRAEHWIVVSRHRRGHQRRQTVTMLDREPEHLHPARRRRTGSPTRARCRSRSSRCSRARISARTTSCGSRTATDAAERMNRQARIFVAGHRGMVGSALVRRLREGGYDNLLLRSRAELDLLDQRAVATFMAEERPDYVFVAAAKVGGIQANDTLRADFLYENLRHRGQPDRLRARRRRRAV